MEYIRTPNNVVTRGVVEWGGRPEQTEWRGFGGSSWNSRKFNKMLTALKGNKETHNMYD